MKKLRLFLFVLFTVLLAIATGSGFAQQNASTPRATPLEPIGAILDAFRSHDIVALGEGNHTNEQSFQFRLALIRDPRFPTVVNDIVVESGNALYQDVMDRFIGQEEVPERLLRGVWQNTTQPFDTFDNPVYEDFFRAVRAVNASLPPARRLRVLLGDPPIDWDRINSPTDVGEWERAMKLRESYPAEVVKREVLAKHRRALVVYGGMHLARSDIDFNYQPDGIVTTLEEDRGTKVFSIWTNTCTDLDKLQDDVASWRRPTLAMLRGTVLGTADFTAYYPFDTRRVRAQGNTFVPIPRSEWETRRLEDLFDAVLYLGAKSEITYHPWGPDCADPAYVKMRLERLALLGMSGAAEQFKQNCAKSLKKEQERPFP